MARLFNDAASEYFTLGSAVVSDEPITLACWFYSDDADSNQTLMSVGDGASTLGWFRLAILGGVGDEVRAQKQSSTGAGESADTSAGYTINTWHHACGVFTGDASRAAYIDGGSKGTNASSPGTDPTMNTTLVGGLVDSSPGSFTSGRIAEAAIWDVALTDNEIKTLAAGVSPLRVRAANLQAYWPLPASTGNAIDYSGNGKTLTDTNTVGAADHAPVAPMFAFAGNTPVALASTAPSTQKAVGITDITITFST